MDGNLLGAIRENRVICQDHDVDLGCMNLDSKLLLYLLQ